MTNPPIFDGFSDLTGGDDHGLSEGRKQSTNPVVVAEL
jgi:hypothetical protein